MAKIDDALSMSFDVVPTKSQMEIVEYKTDSIQDDQIDDDVDYVKEKLNNLLEKGESAFEDLVEIAKAEESPRAFEVLNSMLNTMSDISMKLIEIEERKLKIKKMNGSDSSTQNNQQPSTVNNNSVVFVGTTQELQEQIKKRLSGN